MRLGAILSVVGVMALASGAQAQTPAAACAAMDASLPAEFGGWGVRTPLGAEAALAPGKAVEARLRPTPQVRYPVTPEKPGGTASHGGVLDLDIDWAGTYAVALGAGAWIDVIEDGKAVASTAHGHGPACSTIRKVVDFPLKAGRHVVQISGATTETLPVLVARRP